ncbi:MAG: hypothetical protein V3W20_09260 [Candidatus Neomarinimicrobiota bacterium]
MSEYDKIIEDSHKKQARDIIRNTMTHIKESKFAKNLDVGLYRFIYQMIIGIVMAVAFALGIYYGIMSRLDAQDTKIKTNDTSIVEVKDGLEAHLEDVKDQPLSEQELQNKVKNMKEDVDSNSSEVHRVSDIQIQLTTNQNMLVQNNKEVTDAVIEMKEDIGKIKGKLDIE